MFKPSPECRHIKPGGSKCHALAMKGESYCYHHARVRTYVEANRARKHSVALPPLEDNASLLMALNALYAGHAASKINRRTLGTYLYGLHLADQILSRSHEIPSSNISDSTGAPGLASETGENMNVESAPCPTDATVSSSHGWETTTLNQPTGNQPQSENSVASPAPEAQCLLAPHFSVGDGTQLMSDESNRDDANDPDNRATHESDPEPLLPLTKKELQEERRYLELSLLNYREARAFWAAKVAENDQQDGPPDIPLAYVEKQIKTSEAALEELIRQLSSDPDPNNLLASETETSP